MNFYRKFQSKRFKVFLIVFTFSQTIMLFGKPDRIYFRIDLYIMILNEQQYIGLLKESHYTIHIRISPLATFSQTKCMSQH